jgi:hypothetical protein
MLKRDTVVSEYISCSPLRIHKNGMQSVFMTHAGKPLVFQTDTVRLTPNDKDVIITCSDELTYTLRSIDASILQHAQQRSKEWFGKELDPDAVLQLFSESVVNNVMKAKTIDTDIFDLKKDIHDMSYVHENCTSVIVLQLMGVFFSKKLFGAYWNVKQILASPTKKLEKYAFDDDEVVPFVS